MLRIGIIVLLLLLIGVVLFYTGFRCGRYFEKNKMAVGIYFPWTKAPVAHDDPKADERLLAHSVKPGDTLASISMQYTGAVSESFIQLIRAYNRVTEDANLQTRKTIVLPIWAVKFEEIEKTDPHN